MKKEDIISHIGKPILNPLGTLVLLGIIGVCISPFLWIWFDFVFSLKVFLSSIFLTVICTFLYKFIENIIKEEIDVAELNKDKNISKFQEKLNQKIKEGETPKTPTRDTN